MPGDEDVTLGEMSRRFDRFEKSVLESIQGMHTNFVTTVAWQAWQELMENQRTALGREIAELKGNAKTAAAEKVLEHRELHLRIDNLRADLEAKERAREIAEKAAQDAEAKAKAQRTFTLVAAGFAAILSLGSGIALAIIVNAIGV